MNQAIQTSLATQWQRLTPANRRFVVSLGLLVAAIATIAYFNPFAGPNHVALLPGARLVDDDLARVQLAFGQAGLNDFQVREQQIFVPQAERDQYLKALNDSDALPDLSHSLYEPESSIDIWSNRHQQHEQSLVRKKKMIRQMILQLGFVADAHVNLDELVEGGFPPKTTRKVAVVVRPQGQRVMERHELRAIRDLVIGQVAGLSSADLVITDIAAGYAYDADALAGRGQPNETSLVWLEQTRMAQRVTDWLRQYSESPEVRLVLVESETPQPQPTTAQNPSTTDAGPPALIVNQPVSLPPSTASEPTGLAAASGIDVGKSYRVNLSAYLPAPNMPQTTASEAVGNRPRSLPESQAICEELKPLLVSEVLDCIPGRLDVTVAPVRVPTQAENQANANTPAAWTRNNSLIVVVAALFLLALCVPWLLRPKADQPSRPATQSTPASHPAPRWEPRDRPSSVSLNDETRRRLQQIVRDDPDQAAEIIKDWIREAA